KTVTVVQADDLIWPSSATIMEGGLAADWSAYLYTLRECIEDATLINQGKRPTGSYAKSISGKFQGKIIWLFARNRDEEVGPMFEPLRNKLMVFHAEFPRSYDDRNAILRFYAERNKIIFDEEALKEATKFTMNYSGRDLIGDETGGKGFLKFAITNVRQREKARYKKGKKDINMVITKNVLEDWLKSKECEEITRRNHQLGLTLENPGDNVTIDHPDRQIKNRFPSEQLRSKARYYLDIYENACCSIDGNRISQKEIAKTIDVTRPSISEKCRKYGEVMLAFLDTFPNGWPHLQSKTPIRDWCRKK
ncbi:hypothetical protein ACFL6P_09965, partial [Candidatus Latescibacterota bacterium]